MDESCACVAAKLWSWSSSLGCENGGWSRKSESFIVAASATGSFVECSEYAAECGWKCIRSEKYTKFIIHTSPPTLFIDFSLSHLHQKLKSNESNYASSTTKWLVFMSSTLIGTILVMWINVSVSNITRNY